MRRTLLIATCVAMMPLRAAAEPAATPPEAVPEATPPEATPPEATPPVTASELPPSEVVPATPIEPTPVEPPPPEPAPAPTITVMDPALRLPPRPRYDGRRLLAATYSLTGIAWSLHLVGIGVALGKCTSDACANSRANGFLALYTIGGATQIAALLTGGFGAQRKGIYDAWRYAVSGRPKRNAVAFMAIGGTMMVASLGGTLALLFGVRNTCFDRCTDGEFAAYVLGEQGLLTTMTLGGGLFDYGRGYRRANRHYSGLTFAPWRPRGRGLGAAVTARF